MKTLLLAGSLLYLGVWAKQLTMLLAAERAYMLNREYHEGIHDDTIDDSERNW